MKNLYFLILITALFYNSCQQKQEYKKVNKPEPVPNKDDEDFVVFISDFSGDEQFQKLRILDTATEITYTNEGDSTTEKIDKNKWKFVKLVQGTSISIIYNNFNKHIDNTNERIFSIESIEGGTGTFYYFKRIGTKWFLIKRTIYLD